VRKNRITVALLASPVENIDKEAETSTPSQVVEHISKQEKKKHQTLRRRTQPSYWKPRNTGKIQIISK